MHCAVRLMCCCAHGAALFKTTCCEQYACTLCIVEYLHSQQVGLAPDESAIVEKLPNVKCPYCATPVRFQKVRLTPGYSGLLRVTPGHRAPICTADYRVCCASYRRRCSLNARCRLPRAQQVLSSEAPRRYEDSPAVVRKLAARVPGGTYPSGQEPSPLKVGDTYEDMKRKMVPFEGANGPMSESDLALPTRSGSDNPLESSLPRALEMSFRRMPPLPESPDTPGHAGPGSPRSALSGGTPLQSPIAAVDSNAAEGAEAGSIPFGINSADESSLLAATPEHRGGPPSDTSLTPMSPNAVVPPSPAPIPNP